MDLTCQEKCRLSSVFLLAVAELISLSLLSGRKRAFPRLQRRNSGVYFPTCLSLTAPTAPNSPRVTEKNQASRCHHIKHMETNSLRSFCNCQKNRPGTSAFRCSRSRHLSHIGEKQKEVWNFDLILCFPNCKTPKVFQETGTQTPYKQLFSSPGKAKHRLTNALYFWTRFW